MIDDVNKEVVVMRRVRGFTLLELLVVVVIVAVLATIAIPAYGRYSFRARRVDAQELLLRIASAQERYYATNNKYGALTDVGFANPALSEKGFYSVSLQLAADAQTFTATAAPGSTQASDVCGSLTINNAGVKTPDSASALNSNGSCW